MTSPSPLPRILIDGLGRARLRATRSRLAVLEVLSEANSPLSTSELTDHLRRDGIPLSTIYSTLASLESAGLVRRISFGEEFSRYELSEEFGGHHHHFVCRRCGRVDDLDHEPEVERALKRLATDLETSGRQIESHRLDILGICPSCS